MGGEMDSDWGKILGWLFLAFVVVVVFGLATGDQGNCGFGIAALLALCICSLPLAWLIERICNH